MKRKKGLRGAAFVPRACPNPDDILVEEGGGNQQGTGTGTDHLATPAPRDKNSRVQTAFSFDTACSTGLSL